MSEPLRALKDKGALLFAKGKYEAALEAFEKALALAPADQNARQKVAELCQRVGRTKDAVRHFEALAAGFARGGLLLRAIAACKVLLELEPAHVRTQALLAELYAQRRGPAPRPALPPASEPGREPSFDIEVQPVESAPPAPAGLSPSPLFSSLERDAFVAVLEGMEVRLFQPGEPVVTEGEPGTSMYALVEGRVDVVRHLEGGERRVVAGMGEGDFFGEVALLTGAPRLASVAAKERCLLLEFTRARMEEIVARHPSVGEVLQAFYRERLLANVLRSNPLFSALPVEAKAQVARAFELRSVAPGELLVERGQPVAGLHLLLRGACVPFHVEADGAQTPYPTLREGDVFGEISLLLGQAATASVRAETACTLLWLSRADFERWVRAQPEAGAQLRALGKERLERTARLTSGRTVHPGDTRV